jgi:hypothetical protein
MAKQSNPPYTDPTSASSSYNSASSRGGSSQGLPGVTSSSPRITMLANAQLAAGPSNPSLSLSSTATNQQITSLSDSTTDGEAASVDNGIKIAIAGIVIGAVFGILFIILLIYFSCGIEKRKGRKKRKYQCLVRLNSPQ